MATHRRRAPAALPLHALLQALEAWQEHPGRRSLERLRTVLLGTVIANGATGAHLTLDAPPLPHLTLGVGELSEGPPEAEAPARVRTDILAGGRTGSLGELWVSGPRGAAGVTGEAIGAAIGSAWALAEAQATTGRLEALDTASQAIAAELDLDRVLQLIVDLVRPLVGARYAALGIVDAQGRIERFLTAGVTPARRARIGHPPLGRGLLGLIIREGRSYRVRDIAVHPDRFGFPPHHPPMHSFLGVPVRVGGEPVGNLYLTEKAGGGAFSESDQRLVESFALHTGIAIQNARLHARVHELAVMEDRERIGTDLHDGIIQALYGVGLSLEDVPDLLAEDPDEAARRVERAIQSLHHTIRDTRNFIFELQPELLGGRSLVAGAEQLVEEFRRDTTVQADLRLDAVQVEPPASVVREVLAILSEALSNVARHAQAQTVVVELEDTAGGLTLTVTDDGVGLPDGAEGLIGHQGLRNMRARSARLGAELRMESGPLPGRGTRVRLTVPAATLQP